MTDALTVDWDDDVSKPMMPAVESFETAIPVATPAKEVKINGGAQQHAADRRGGPTSPASRAEAPSSPTAEEQLIACCMMDGPEIIPSALSAGITSTSASDPKLACIIGVLIDLHRRGEPTDIGVVAEELTRIGKLNYIGGAPILTQISQRIPTTAQASYFIRTVRDLEIRRALIVAANEISERARDTTEEINSVISESSFKISTIGRDVTSPTRSLTDFSVPPDGDSSVLLGDRYLNRGDGAVLSSTSGMGKSSLSLQMAVLWALGRPAFGIRPNGPLTSLIIQSEDSDGDVAEVWESLRHCLALTDEDISAVQKRLHIVSDRTSRGPRLIARLRSLIRTTKPDLVWLNPLQAFIDGDVTDSQDLGKFLREGLNSLNEPATFGYFIVHHTTKPSTGKDRNDRQWHEVMYDMAGGAEIINWARAIMSLRATPEKGEFTLELAKRGTRAGIEKRIEDGLNTRVELQTSIPLKHSRETIHIPGRKRPMRAIFWEGREATAPEEKPESKRGGANRKYTIDQFRSSFPAHAATPLRLSPIYQAVIQSVPVGTNRAFFNLVQRFVEDGEVERVIDKNGIHLYRLAY